MSLSRPIKQDLAPSGGYQAIQWKRVIRPNTSGWKVFAGLVALHAYGLWSYTNYKQTKLFYRKEAFDSRLALLPFYLAEEDRYEMKKLRAWREFETDLMKDVPDWETGKFRDQKLYHKDSRHFNMQFKNEVRDLSEPFNAKERLRQLAASAKN